MHFVAESADCGKLFTSVRHIDNALPRSRSSRTELVCASLLASGQFRHSACQAQNLAVQLPKDSKVIVACQKGLRSLAACEQLSRAGYKNVAWINGGFDNSTAGQIPTRDGQDVRLGGIGGLSSLLGWTEVQQENAGPMGGFKGVLVLVRSLPDACKRKQPELVQARVRTLRVMTLRAHAHAAMVHVQQGRCSGNLLTVSVAMLNCEGHQAVLTLRIAAFVLHSAV